jgi:hypothetical protein
VSSWRDVLVEAKKIGKKATMRTRNCGGASFTAVAIFSMARSLSSGRKRFV